MPDLTIDHLFPQVFIDGMPLLLTRREYDVLLLLYENKGRICTKKLIYDNVWGNDHFGSDNAIERIILQIRRKLQAYNLETKLITKRGFGYTFIE